MPRETPSCAAALALAILAACANVRATGAGPGPADSASRATALREGVYAACVGAYAHNESLVLREGEFRHFIRSHGSYGGRSSGDYTVMGDTVVINVTQTGPALYGVQRALGLSYDFVIGEYAGYDVLWRGTAAATRSVADTGEMSEYAALFYGGPDPDRREVPSCDQVRSRLSRTGRS
jgi:hypothetical protein